MKGTQWETNIDYKSGCVKEYVVSVGGKNLKENNILIIYYNLIPKLSSEAATDMLIRKYGF